MKKIVIFFICLVILTVIVGCKQNQYDMLDISSPLVSPSVIVTTPEVFRGDKNMNSNCSLIVNGKKLSSVHYVYLHQKDAYAELPLIAILEAFGASVEWETKVQATIAYNGKSYILDASKNSFVEKNKFRNYIALPPGSTHGGIYRLMDQEFIVDSDSMWSLIQLIGGKITIDCEDLIIFIEIINK